MERRRDGQAPHGEPRRLEALLGALDRADRAREHDLSRAVVVREHDVEALDRALHGRQLGGDGGHGARDRTRARHQLAAATRDRDAGALVEEPRRDARGDLAEAVPADDRRREPRLLEQSEHPEARRRDPGLRPLGRRQLLLELCARLVPEDRARVDAVRERLAASVHGRRGVIPDLAHTVEVHREIGAHADVLTALPGEEHRDRARRRERVRAPGRVVDAARRGERRVAALLDRLCRGAELVAGVRFVRRDDRDARVRRRVERELLLLREVHERARRAAALGRFTTRDDERRRARRGEQQELRRRRVQARGALRGAHILFERDVEVRAAEAERADGRAARVRGVVHPRARLGVEVERALVEVQLLVRRADLDGRRQHLVVEREDRLDHARRAGRGLRVADLRLHGAERAVVARCPRLVEHDAQRLDLGGVARDRARAVRLDEADRLGPIASVRIRAPQRERLPGGGGRVDALRLAVRRRAEPPDHGVDRVAIALGVVEPTKRQHADALAEHRAVGLIRERPTVAAQGERARLREAHVHQDVVERVDAARQHEVGVAERQVVDRHRDRGERARARGVDDDVRPAEVEAVGHATGDDVPEQPGEGALLPRHVAAIEDLADARDLVGLEASGAHGVLDDRLLQAPAHRADELRRRRDAEHHAHAAAVDGLELPAGRLEERVLGDDEREQLRGVRRGHGVRRHAVLHGRELDLGEEAAPRRVDLVRRAGLRVVVVRREPVRARDIRQPVAALEDVAPEGERRRRAWEERAEADDRDGRRGLEVRVRVRGVFTIGGVLHDRLDFSPSRTFEVRGGADAGESRARRREREHQTSEAVARAPRGRRPRGG